MFGYWHRDMPNDRILFVLFIVIVDVVFQAFLAQNLVMVPR
jgi:hypothetical protein